VPARHRTDSLSAAVQLLDGSAAFTRRYQGLLAHYGLTGEQIQPGKAHENGDVEQRHHRFRTALDQALMLRGSRDFPSREAYDRFLAELFDQLNAGRTARRAEEVARLRPLPPEPLDVTRSLRVRVGPSSTIRVLKNTYSVPSRLIGEVVVVRVAVEQLEVWYGQRRVEQLPRLRGHDQHYIQYRHVIDWLVRKPGAFAQYRYRSDLFPTSRFRVAYDTLEAGPETGIGCREGDPGSESMKQLPPADQGPLSPPGRPKAARTGARLPWAMALALRAPPAAPLGAPALAAAARCRAAQFQLQRRFATVARISSWNRVLRRPR
jgi:hypothetical protein